MEKFLTDNAARHAPVFLAAGPEFLRRLKANTEKYAVQDVTGQEIFDAFTKIVADLITAQKMPVPAQDRMLEILESLSMASANEMTASKEIKACISGSWSPFSQPTDNQRVQTVEVEAKKLLNRDYGFDPRESLRDTSRVLFLLTCLATAVAKLSGDKSVTTQDLANFHTLALRGKIILPEV